MVGLARSENVAHASPNATKVHVISGMVKPWGLSKPVGLMWFICRCHRTATLPVTGGSTAAWRMLDIPDIPGEAVHFLLDKALHLSLSDETERRVYQNSAF